MAKQKTKQTDDPFSKVFKATTTIAIGGLGLSAINVAAQSGGGNPNGLQQGISGFTQNIGAALPTVGTLLGTALVVGSARQLGKISFGIQKRLLYGQKFILRGRAKSSIGIQSIYGRKLIGGGY